MSDAYKICDNPHSLCLHKSAKLFCECGGKLHPVGSIEGARLKVLREQKKKGATSCGMKPCTTGGAKSPSTGTTWTP